jgi:prepilin-type N-terminal cleavage/methylation domain-containing protein
MTNMETKNDVKKLTRAALRGQAGMTMLEILIVLAILALVMAFLIGPRVMEWFGQSKKTLAGPMVDEYASKAYPLWSRDNMGKQCPDSLQDLAKYTNKEDPKDPWGNELLMVCGENAPEGVPNHFGVISKGEDGKLDTQDDIKSWERKNR